MNNAAHLLVNDSGKGTTTVSMEKNTSLFAGSGANCRIVLSGADVSSIHCRLWLDSESTLRVQDWNTGKTLLNGQCITSETEFNIGDKLTIGTNEIIPIAASDLGDDEFEMAMKKKPLVAKAPIESAPEPASDCGLQMETFDPETNESKVSCDEVLESIDSQEGNAFSYDLNLEEMESGFAGENAPCLSFGGHSDDDDEEVELLRMEVEQLRFEIAERDSQLQSLSEGQAFCNDQDERQLEAEEDTIRLVNRLEDLLEELQSTDKRARGLEELLRVSDEATRAEQEERSQLESWVSEIEQRVSQREAEAEAEMARFKRRFQDLQAQLQQSQMHLKQALSARSETASASDQELIRALRDQLESLQKQLDQAAVDNERLQKEDSQDGRHTTAEYQALEQNFIELQVSTSRERAELAREKEKLTRMKEEFEKKLDSNADADDANSRIRAMREHLKEVHERECEERKNRTLGSRISRLLGTSSK